MKSVMLSIQPRHCDNICTVIGEENGKPVYKKTIEVRKTRPSIETPFKCYVYETKRKVMKSFVWKSDDGLIAIPNRAKVIPINKTLRRVKYNVRGRGKVIGEFVCDKVERFSVGSLRCDDIEELACLSYREMLDYFYKPEELDGKTMKFGYAWHISDLKIYDKPKELGEFRKPCPFPSEDCEELCKYAEVRIHTAGDEELIEIVDCHNRFTRPPQSWGYVEEI